MNTDSAREVATSLVHSYAKLSIKCRVMYERITDYVSKNEYLNHVFESLVLSYYLGLSSFYCGVNAVFPSLCNTRKANTVRMLYSKLNCIKSTDSNPTDAKSNDSKPIDSKPTDAKSTDAKPNDSKPTVSKLNN